MKTETPFIAVGNGELDNNGPVGKFITCPHCSQDHDIKYGKEKNAAGEWVESRMLAFYKCGEKSYLAGINGQLLK